jgi:hypothetical protein
VLFCGIVNLAEMDSKRTVSPIIVYGENRLDGADLHCDMRIGLRSA